LKLVIGGDNMVEHKQEDLGYEFNELEPNIDAQTMEIHYSKHHAGYIQKLNISLENNSELQEKYNEKFLQK
jgi:Fe-Mn family superoxide dismutase|tara:strand:+ start:446 stop:658 length:213 start_codon:yes stop_codon:yes gene_type:complete